MKIPFNLILTAAMLLAACGKSNPSGNSGGGGGGTPPPSPATVSTFAGSTTPGGSDGTKQQASFDGPGQICMDQLGNMYVADRQNNTIRKISLQAVVTTIAGNGQAGFSNTAGAVTFNSPGGLCVNAGGNQIYVADQFNDAVRLITNQATVTTFAGDGHQGFVNALGTAASFFAPAACAIDSNGSVYVADGGNNVIRKIDYQGNVTTFAGSGQPGATDGTGTAALFNGPASICIDKNGNLFVADAGNNTIRKITPQGVVTTVAGNGKAGYEDGKLTASEFNSPEGVAVDTNGNLYVSDTNNNLIRKIGPTGVVSTLAGTGQKGSSDGSYATAMFSGPQGLVVASDGRIFVVDTGNSEIRVLTPVSF